MLEEKFVAFVSKNFVPPEACKSIGQVKFYIDELYTQIEEYSGQFNYIPKTAFQLVSRYNAVQKNLMASKRIEQPYV